VSISTDLATDLALLTDALDVPTSDIAATLAALSSDSAIAVSSYVGLSVRICSRHDHVEFSTVESAEIDSIATSLRVPMAPELPDADGTRYVLVLYAASPGALVDLAADLAWLTGRPIDELRLDEDLGDPAHLQATDSLRSRSTIDQALGVLMGQGRTAEQARTELEVRAGRDGVPRHAAAIALLGSLPPGGLPDEA
jgi:hypothetical protein